jgi:hypothetical protein
VYEGKKGVVVVDNMKAAQVERADILELETQVKGKLYQAPKPPLHFART